MRFRRGVEKDGNGAAGGGGGEDRAQVEIVKTKHEHDGERSANLESDGSRHEMKGCWIQTGTPQAISEAKNRCRLNARSKIYMRRALPLKNRLILVYSLATPSQASRVQTEGDVTGSTQ